MHNTAVNSAALTDGVSAKRAPTLHLAIHMYDR